MSKVWWKSKTLWFNIVSAALAVLNELAPVLEHLAHGGYDEQTVASVRAIIALALIIGNSVLRLLTTESVTLRNH
ncbi:hypothetical protein [Pukyongiella litopenaei]|uniref:Holin n=1 Tax=Pukyongiella litopenaei TaxID=2605946 RepID=A0A2S0MNC7_9RHOB|nr:hypothetical protein [Pukyongiella litopenaei]AVO37380.1 hypothetical protein C6Y53_06430 [Pukyongiella litopenaei]